MLVVGVNEFGDLVEELGIWRVNDEMRMVSCCS